MDGYTLKVLGIKVKGVENFKISNGDIVDSKGICTVVKFGAFILAPLCIKRVEEKVKIPSWLPYKVEEFNKPFYLYKHPLIYNHKVSSYVGRFPGSVWFRPASIYQRKIDVPSKILMSDEEDRKSVV